MIEKTSRRNELVKTTRFTLNISRHHAVSVAISQSDRLEPAAVVLIAHGAGNDMEHPLLVSLGDDLATAGYRAIRFNFPYAERKLKTPDTQDVLEETWQSVYDFVIARSGAKPPGVFTAGKSMGGRVASEMLAKGVLRADGMVFLGYPLHPPGRQDKCRDRHLYEISVPMLFFVGTRDPLCDVNSLKRVLSRLSPRPTLEMIEGGDHSFEPPEAFATSRIQTYQKIAAKTIAWMRKQGFSNEDGPSSG
jgi:predicted alpha/beta-hydrolase family hydrolase